MRAGLLLGAVVALSGCSSFRTQAVDRLENDTLVVNPNCPLKGIPVSLRIPTHLELCVVETTYWEKIAAPGEKPSLEPLSTCRPTRTVTYDVKETEKVFLVDPVRPGAGTQSYGFEFQPNTAANKKNAGKGYLKNVNYKIDDKTITESANLLATSLSLVQGLATGANELNRNTSDLISTDRTVAFARFDINSPCFEADVANFLDCHVNGTICCSVKPEVCQPDCWPTSK